MGEAVFPEVIMEMPSRQDEAFLLLGQEPLLKNRNHHRALRREIEWVRELLRLIGGEVDPDLQAALDAGEEP